MLEPTKDRSEDAPLNPALKSRTETVYDTEHRTPDPLDTTEAKEGQGEGWPVVWLVVTAVCVLLAAYLLF